jgi:hypothetical protein
VSTSNLKCNNLAHHFVDTAPIFRPTLKSNEFIQCAEFTELDKQSQEVHNRLIVSFLSRRPTVRVILWHAKLDSDYNERYWRAITQKYGRYDLSLKIFLAFATSGTVAGWGIWSDAPLLWKGLSALSALASIASPLLSFNKKMEAAANHAGKWTDLRVRYAALWETYRSKGETDMLIREQTRLQKIFAELHSKEPMLKIPEDKKIAKQSQAEVVAANKPPKDQ